MQSKFKLTKQIINHYSLLERFSVECRTQVSEPHYESEAKCKVFIMKISFHSYASKTNFNMKNFALSLTFIMRFTATWKWTNALALGYALLHSVIGQQYSRRFCFFNQWKAKSRTNRNLRFRALYAAYMYLLRVLIGSFSCLCL